MTLPRLALLAVVLAVALGCNADGPKHRALCWTESHAEVDARAVERDTCGHDRGGYVPACSGPAWMERRCPTNYQIWHMTADEAGNCRTCTEEWTW